MAMTAVAVYGISGTAEAEPIVIMFAPMPFGSSTDYITTTTWVKNNLGQTIDLIAGRYEVAAQYPELGYFPSN
jgi:hypothetical protein